MTDSEEYREGKVKENPFRGVKKYMKPLSDKLWEGLHFYAETLTACLWKNEPATYREWRG